MPSERVGINQTAAYESIPSGNPKKTPAFLFQLFDAADRKHPPAPELWQFGRSRIYVLTTRHSNAMFQQRLDCPFDIPILIAADYYGM